MAKRAGFLETRTHKRSLKYWRAEASAIETADLADAEGAAAMARDLRGVLDHIIRVSEDRTALPRPGSNAFRNRRGTDWSWRPSLWRGPAWEKGVAGVQSGQQLSDEAKIFHDCHYNDLTFRQVRNSREGDLSVYGTRLDVFNFDGSFLSLALELPDDSHAGLQKTHLFRLDAVLDMERPLEIFARLNIKHGPNVEQIVRELPLHQKDVWVEFDLGYIKFNEKRVEQIWVDLIFEGPRMNQVTLRDVTLSRGRRAEL